MTNAKTTPTSSASKSRYPDLAKRIAQACDGNPNVPPPNFGRLGWIQTQFENRGVSISIETVRRWLGGEARPRAKMMQMLAQTLSVDHAWLALGSSPEMTEKQQAARNATASGAVNLIAGLIQMGGGTPAFPDEPGDTDLTAIIKGAQYSIHVATADHTDKGWKFAVPIGALNDLVLGVIRTGEMSFRIVELDADGLESEGRRNGGHLVVTMSDDLLTGEHQWGEIKTFSQRL